jgi:hypothetical protein
MSGPLQNVELKNLADADAGYVQLIQQYPLNKQELPSEAASTAKKVGAIAFALFGSLGVLIAFAAVILTVLASHGAVAVLLPFLAPAAKAALSGVAATFAPYVAYTAAGSLGIAALGGITNRICK